MNLPPSQIIQWPRVSCVVLAHNRRNLLARTLERLTSCVTYAPNCVEIIVVDNASTDGTPEMVSREFPHVRLLVNNENQGASGWNRGFSAATGNYVFILDDDCFPLPGTLQHAVSAAESYRADLVSLTVRSTRGVDRSFNDFYPTGLLSYWGCAALVRKQALDLLGGYDPHLFIWGNELEFTMRLLDRGLRHLFLADAVAIHQKPLPQRGLYQSAVHRTNLRNFAYIAGKLLQPRDSRVVFGRLVAGLLVTSLRRPLSLGIVRHLVEGWRSGRRAHRPVRPEISTLYRDHFHGFIHRTQYQLRLRPWAAFFADHRAYYPAATALLEIPRDSPAIRP